ncbi:hypothetical protein TWF481_011585 [Arthrobotrys musiformis]|uniref:F-box domain-containing protein n=1 Tax=Arthrobotrys musiformis TaxID=47236 RepID=A0AAV9VYR8_9PEZI
MLSHAAALLARSGQKNPLQWYRFNDMAVSGERFPDAAASRGKPSTSLVPPSAPIHRLPKWLVAEILQYLSPDEMIMAIQNIKAFRKGLAFWNSCLTRFDRTQLSYLFCWNEFALSIEEPDPYSPDLRDQIYDVMREDVTKLKRTTEFPVPMDSRSLDLVWGAFMKPNYDENLSSFTGRNIDLGPADIEAILRRTPKEIRSIQLFCTKVMSLHIETGRGTPVCPSANPMHEIFSTFRVIGSIITWSQYYRETPPRKYQKRAYDIGKVISCIGNIFGNKGVNLVSDLIGTETGIVANYLEFIQSSSPEFLPEIHNRLGKRRGIHLTTFASYAISDDFGMARRLLEEDPEAIETLEEKSDEQLMEWQEFWNSFMDFLRAWSS